jgi:Zn-dependent protease/CBS domain-containing protein
MKWSWRILTAFGIKVYVHSTFLLLILFVILNSAWTTGGSMGTGLFNGLLILSLFACVLLHEFGHALTARRFGIRTRDITLLPIGGIARLERIPSDPRQELLIAAAGPPVNLAIAALLFLLGMALGWEPYRLMRAESLELSVGTFLRFLLWTNLFIAFFNLIPAFPMDGGRILRALLAMRGNYLRATRIAVSVGQVLAFGFGLWGLLSWNFILIIIAFFIYMGATQEGAMVQYRHAFQGLPTSCAMITDFKTLEEEDRVEKAVEYLLLGTQIDFPVLRDHAVLGMLTRGALIDSLKSQGPEATLRQAAVKAVRLLDHDLPLDLAYEALQEESMRSLPVVRGGELVGLITMENLVEFAMVKSALGARDSLRSRHAA